MLELFSMRRLKMPESKHDYVQLDLRFKEGPTTAKSVKVREKKPAKKEMVKAVDELFDLIVGKNPSPEMLKLLRWLTNGL